MYRPTPAEIFIATLSELLDDESDDRSARLRLQLQAQVERHMKPFLAEVNDNGICTASPTKRLHTLPE
jgi:hypothetical protein